LKLFLKNRFTIYIILYPFLLWVISSVPAPDFGEVFDWYDKFLHFLIYGVFGLITLGFALERRFGLGQYALPNSKAILIAILIPAIYGIIDEYHQSFVPHRKASTGDFLADFLGALIWVLVALLLLNALKRKSIALQRNVFEK
jgi:VanZ family protein